MDYIIATLCPLKNIFKSLIVICCISITSYFILIKFY